MAKARQPTISKEAAPSGQIIKKHQCPCCGSWDYCAMVSFGWQCTKPVIDDKDCWNGCYENRLLGKPCEHPGKEKA